MAAARARAQAPVGSSKWVYDERKQADDIVQQEAEEFAFSARNDMDWLNEHMAEIFARGQLDVTDVFKTPGKLRGKTPRTARKQNLENREPLTDVFASTPQNITNNPSQFSPQKQVPKFHVAEDKENQEQITQHHDYVSKGTETTNTDSGYHGLTEDETDVETQQRTSQIPRQDLAREQNDSQKTSTSWDEPQRGQGGSTAGSFTSANEAQSEGKTVQEPSREAPQAQESHSSPQPSQDPKKAIVPEHLSVRESHQYNVSAETAAGLDKAVEEVEERSKLQTVHDESKDRSSSPGSSPERPLIRKKSSLNFAALPAREPMPTKKSFGPQASQSTGGQSTGGDKVRGKSSIAPRATESEAHTRKASTEVESDAGNETDSSDENLDHALIQTNSEASKLHNKTSTQKLHERITMLGKLNPARPSKSVTSMAPVAHNRNPSHGLGQKTMSGTTHTNSAEANDDDWIGPITQKQSDEMPKSSQDASQPPEVEMDVDSRSADRRDEQQNEKSSEAQEDHEPPTTRAVYPNLNMHQDKSTTPPGSPVSKWNMDGPLSASKAKFNSFLKSAKGIFASSAAASASAKMETLSAGPTRGRKDDAPSLDQASQARPEAQDAVIPDRIINAEVTDADPGLQKPEAARVHDAEHEQQTTGHETAESGLDHKTDKGEEIEDQESGPSNDPQALVESSQASQSEREGASAVAQSHAAGLGPNMHKPGELRRPATKLKNESQKSKPATLSIRVPSSWAAGQNKQMANSSSQDSQPQPSSLSSKPPNLVKKGSNQSLRPASSAQSMKQAASMNSSKVKALESAARKKEQAEKESQRKAEQKREIERRRAAKMEEEKRQAQEQKNAEQQRALEAKNMAQRQAAEQRRAELVRKQEQMRQQAQQARDMNDEASRHDVPSMSTSQNGFAMNAQNPRAPANTSQGALVRPVPHINPAKPPKRYFQPDDDEEGPRFAQNQAAPQPKPQNPAKRRKTSEEANDQTAARPTMAPPIRLSNMRKDAPNKFNHSYMSQHGTSQAGPSGFKASAAHSMQHPKTPHMADMAKYAHGRVPFAEGPNTNTQPSQTQQQQQQQQGRNPPHASTKTPATAHKYSPQYPNGENISLPDIATDSEDEDSDDEFNPPSWANSPALRELLSQQQLVDPQRVFGTIGPLNMEEVFRNGGKEKQAKFRARTSSANWGGADRLTEEERRRDFEAREKLEKDGEWSYNARI
ncbi:MAG: hypothetical protein M1831_002115 [Alyxoria varia]|nr:MAG: hypothetical protein M1831_002115 [Alyxoria varia]